MGYSEGNVTPVRNSGSLVPCIAQADSLSSMRWQLLAAQKATDRQACRQEGEGKKKKDINFKEQFLLPPKPGIVDLS